MCVLFHRRQGSGWVGAVASCLVLGSLANAQPANDDIRRIAQNPFANVIKVPIEGDLYFGAGPFSRSSSSVEIQPVIPFLISEDWLVVPRIVATATAYQPDTSRDAGGVVGTGDTTPTFFFTPEKSENFVWGFGPSILIPTATNTALGSGKWAAGPSIAVQWQPQWGSLGVLIQNVWSFAGNSHRASVKQMLLEYSLSYNLSRGWYLTTGPTISADWTQSNTNRWLIPSGGGVGRTVKVGKKAVDANACLYVNGTRPESNPYPKWQFSLQVTLFFPER